MNTDWYPDQTKLKADYTGKHHQYQTAMMALWRDIETTLEAMNTRVTVKGRIKSFESYFEKLLKRHERFRSSGVLDPIHDIMALRVVCPFLEDVNQAEAILRAGYTIHDVEHKGEQHTIGEFGYNCVHLVVAIPQRISQRVPFMDIETAEVQIRTILQDAWAEVEHELIYKSHIAPLDTPLRRKLAALNATLSLSDITFQEIRDYQRKLHKELDKRRQSFSAEHIAQLSQSHIDNMESSYEIAVPQDIDSPPEVSNRNMDELLVEALHAHNRKEYLTAIELYTTILQSSIDSSLRVIVLIHRGVANFCQTRYELALEDFTAATQCEPDNGRAFYHLGAVLRVLGNHADAVRNLQRSIELNPYRLEALMELAYTLFETGNYSAARGYCEKVLKISPKMPAALKLRSDTLTLTTCG